MNEGEVHYSIANGVASIVFDRPLQRNAMTWAMYDGLALHQVAAQAEEAQWQLLDAPISECVDEQPTCLGAPDQ